MIFLSTGETAMIMDNSPILGNKEICVLEVCDSRYYPSEYLSDIPLRILYK